MTLDVRQFSRKSFPVDAVQVTAENMAEVAKWCDAEVHISEPDDTIGDRYIQVRVLNPLTTRQTRAYVGDWVLYAGKGYKVYTHKGFLRSFDPKESVRVPQEYLEESPPVHNVFNSADSGSGASQGTAANPGGTHAH